MYDSMLLSKLVMTMTFVSSLGGIAVHAVFTLQTNNNIIISIVIINILDGVQWRSSGENTMPSTNVVCP